MKIETGYLWVNNDETQACDTPPSDMCERALNIQALEASKTAQEPLNLSYQYPGSHEALKSLVEAFRQEVKWSREEHNFSIRNERVLEILDKYARNC